MLTGQVRTSKTYWFAPVEPGAREPGSCPSRSVGKRHPGSLDAVSAAASNRDAYASAWRCPQTLSRRLKRRSPAAQKPSDQGRSLLADRLARSTGQRVVAGERLRESWYRFVCQLKNCPLDRPPQGLWQGLDLLPGRAREADQAVTYVFPHASARCPRVNVDASSPRPGPRPGPGPGLAWVRLLAVPRAASRRRRLSSACSASSSARGMLTMSDASALTYGSLASARPGPQCRTSRPAVQIGEVGRARH
jgi:hypothetical protein